MSSKPSSTALFTIVIIAVLCSAALFLLMGFGPSWRSLMSMDRSTPGHSTPGPAPVPPVTTQPRACTMEAKQCPDGSYVGRGGPNCEFAACPTGASTDAKVRMPL